MRGRSRVAVAGYALLGLLVLWIVAVLCRPLLGHKLLARGMSRRAVFLLMGNPVETAGGEHDPSTAPFGFRGANKPIWIYHKADECNFFVDFDDHGRVRFFGWK